MREKRACMVFWVVLVIFTGGICGALWAADPVQSDSPVLATLSVGYLENITLESPMPGKERVVISVSQLSGATVESPPGKALVVKLENTFVPQDFRRSIGEGTLYNIIRILPAQKVVEGRQWAFITIDLKERIPHTVRQEGRNVLIDFSLSNIPEKVKTGKQIVSASRDNTEGAAGQQASVGDVAVTNRSYEKAKISIDFQDANIKSVLRLLAELAEVNIVSGDDVKGNVTIQMKNVPWDQALDTILSITGLGRTQAGNVITVTTLEKIRKDEEARQAVVEAKRKAEAAQQAAVEAKLEAKRKAEAAQQAAMEAKLEAKRKAELEQLKPPPEPLVTRIVNIDYTDAKKLTENLLDLLPKDKDGKTQGSVKVDEHSNALIIQATRHDMTRLFPLIEKLDKPTPQILIKANIVQTSQTTARTLGIQWGGIYGQKIGDQGLFITPGGSGSAAASPLAGTFTPATGARGISGQGFGVNFPGPGPGAGGSLGLLFGTIGSNILDVQLSALQTDGKVNILSSPSLITLDNQKAFTESGQKVPFTTLETSGGAITRTVKFENVVLRLEITPHVIDGKNLKMKILVQKDEIGAATVAENPIINKRQTETNLIVQDNETIVISGLTEQRNDESTSGVPWLKDIPVLGWLFKGQKKDDKMDEVLIFITPTILKSQAVGGIQEAPL